MQKGRRSIFAVLSLLGALAAGGRSALALEPPARGEIQRYLLDGTLAARLRNAGAFGNHLVAPELVFDLRQRMARVRLGASSAARGGDSSVALSLPSGTRNVLPSKGSDKVFALLIQFTDYPAVNSADTIASKLFGDGDTGWPYESLRNYYRRSSYGMLEIGGNVLGWYTPSYTRASMPQTTAAREAVIKEALTYFHDRGQSFAQYDNDGNGVIDYFIVIWTGPNNGWANFWWGYQATFSDATFKLDGKSFQNTRYSWQWEARNWPGAYDQVVVIHETGHALGLPDYYDYDATAGPGGGLGGLDMMDANKGDHNCFSKMLLDWITPQILNFGTRNFALGASGNTRDALVAMPEFASAQPFSEFFIVQNRLRVDNDSGLPGDGLLIWHVDAQLNSSGTFIYDNSYTDHKLLRLMEADGLDEIEQGYAADAGDYYTAGKTFLPYSSPSSQRYDYTDSGVSVFAIGANQQTMAFSSDIHYSIYPLKSLSLERRADDYIFFKEYVNRLTWTVDARNHVPIAKYVISAKDRGASDSAYALLAEVSGSTTVYEHRGLKASGFFSYRVVAVDQNGVKSSPAEVTNAP
jgi:M6 family metalloprotease-like protein